MNQLLKRLSELESAIAHTQQSHTLNNLHISGLMEVEANHIESSSETESPTNNTHLATFELAMLAPINQHTQAEITFLYEEQDTPFEVDSAVIAASLNSNFNITMGQMYLPFGTFETHQVNDTLALEIAEIRHSALMTNYESNGFKALAYVFANEAGKLNQFGMRVGFQNQFINLTADYLNNALNSEAFKTLIETDESFINVNDTPTICLQLSAQISNTTIQAEHLAIDSFNELTLSASQLEVSYHFTTSSLAIAFQQTQDAQQLDLPQKRASLSAAMELLPNTGLAVEVWKDTNKDSRSSNNLVVQAAVKF